MARNKNNTSATTLMMGSLAAIIGGGTALNLGSTGSSETVSALLFMLISYMAGTLGIGFAAERRNKPLNQWMSKLSRERKQLTRKYNDVTDMLEQSYLNETSQLAFFSSGRKRALRQHYDHLYKQNMASYKLEAARLEEGVGNAPQQLRKFKRYWTIVFVTGITLNIAGCCYTAGVLGKETPAPTTSDRVAVSESNEALTEWDAETVPMPHVSDGSRYVSNPDGVVSTHTEQLLNGWLKRMDDSLQIESAMVIVNHVKDQDIFTFAQTLFDKYKIGKDDRGLVIVLAYGDHKVRSHTGRALEADLTDIECSRLQQTYAVPFMKAEQPDSGMLYLTEAIYNTLKKKELPLTWEQQQESESEMVAGLLMLFIMLLMVWPVAGVYIKRRYSGQGFSSMLRSNPFAEVPIVVVGGGGGGSHGGGSFGGGGGFGGGGFSGGSSGGGGATSSW